MAVTQHSARAALEQLIAKFNDKTQTLQTKKAREEAFSERDVINAFIMPLLRDVLGWDTEDPDVVKYELNTDAGRPDLTLMGKPTIFVEAKRLTWIEELPEFKRTVETVIKPEQLPLTGMVKDRTKEEQQAINYAFENGGVWAILTNFEKFRVYNARRDTLVFSIENPTGYLDEFEMLWQFARPNVNAGGLAQLEAVRHRANVDEEYLRIINEWRMNLAQDIHGNQASNAWAFDADGTVRLPQLRRVVQRILDRLVVLRFAEDHFVLPPGSLENIAKLVQNNPYGFSMNDHITQFFSKFDERHNSALFAKHIADKAVFTDETLLALVAQLYHARYRAMPADILGNTYEQFLGKTLAIEGGAVVTRDNLETRKKQGSYYTPAVIVEYIVDNSLGRYLYGTANGKPDGEPLDGETRKTLAEIGDLRVLDSACGSGSFLIYAYRVLAGFYEAERAAIAERIRARKRELAGQNLMPMEIDSDTQVIVWENTREQTKDYPRIILETHLYGVDLDPAAAEIAVINLMMRALENRANSHQAIDTPPLPLILNQNVQVGNALIGVRPDDAAMGEHKAALGEIRRLRAELVGTRNTDPRHDEILEELTAARAALTATLDERFADHFTDLGAVRPFHWGAAFPEVFYDADGEPLANGGFTVVIGNPPWEIVKPDLREFYAQFDADIESRMTRKQADARIAELKREDPERETLWQAQTAVIEASAAYYRATDDYSKQGRGDTATHKLFTERMYGLLRDGGRLGYVVPSGIYTDLGTKQLREMLLNEGRIDYIYSFSNERFFFPGVHHSFKFVLLGAQKGTTGDGFWAAFRFNPRVAVAPDDLPGFLSNKDNLIYVETKTIPLFSPSSMSIMEFQQKRDYDIAAKIYKSAPALGEDVDGAWALDFAREFDMANDSNLFNQREQGYPLYEGKMIHQFDGYYAAPRYWIDQKAAEERLSNSRYADWHKGYRFAFREIARSTDVRTCMAAVLPPNTFAGHTLWVGVAPEPNIMLYYISLVNSYCIDWTARFRVGTHVTLTVMKSLCFPRLTAGNPFFDAIVSRAARLTCTREVYADLWQSVTGEAWDKSKGATDEDERQRLRDEIDGLVAHLYGLSRDEYAHILGTFPLVFPDDDAGGIRREAVLAAYDAMKP